MHTIWHIIPHADSEEHEQGATIVDDKMVTCNCNCGAYLTTANKDYFIIHKSFDGREGLIAVDNILNSQDFNE